VAIGLYSYDETTEYYSFDISPENIFLHPEYNCRNFNNDLSMIYLPGSVTFSGKFIQMHTFKWQKTYIFAENIYPINLPYGDSAATNYEDRTVYLTGFGLPEECNMEFPLFI